MNQIIIKEHTILSELLIDKDLIVIDLGACMGEFISDLEKLYPIKKAIMVEPSLTNFEKIVKKDNYHVLNKIVSSESNTKKIFYEDLDSPYNGSILFEYFQNKNQYELDTISLTDLIKLAQTDGIIDILKIDIEGSEYDVLLNATDADLSRFRQITVEFHDFVDGRFRDENKKIEKRLTSLGFDIIKKGTTYKEGSDFYDTLFFKK